MGSKFKQAISSLLAAALLVSAFWFAPAARSQTPEIPVILYHRVVQNPTNEFTDTSVENFRNMMKYLHDNGYTTLTADQYVDIMDGAADPETVPAKPILLTFDDGTPDFVTTALPILEQYGMNAVAFIVTGWIDGGYAMTLAQLQDLAANHPNVSLQSHTANHANNAWNAMTQEEASAELAQANAYLTGITGKDPVLLAYPYGQYHADVQAAAAENGIRYAFKVGYPNDGNYALGRYYVQPSTTLSDFASWIGGPAPTVDPDTVIVYQETFAGGQGAATPSGNAHLTPVTGKAFEGNEDGAALYVSNRANNWDAADFKFADLGLENGKTYTVTVTGYVDSGENVPAGAQVWLQTVNSYGWLAGADFAAGSAFTMTKEFTVDASKDSALRVQSNDAGAGVPFYIGDILITEKAAAGGGNDNRPPAVPFNTIDFEDQTTGGFMGRAGTETLTVTDEANHTAGGSYALKVENRTQAWHGPALRVEKYVDLDYAYKISVWVKLISPASSQIQLSTQIGEGSGASYNNILGKTISTADGWVLYEGTYRYAHAGGEYLTIYVESSDNSAASFYIDDISFVRDSGPIEVQKDLTPIKTAYQNDFLIGNAVSQADLDGTRLELLKMHHNVVTAENAMKPDGIQPTKGNFTFAGADAIVDQAIAEGLKVHGHVLVWHQQTPAWMNTTTDSQNNTVPLSREEALENMRTHIQTVMEHFGDKVISWDVVNEAMNDNPPNPNDWKASLRQSPWYSAIGSDYVEQAFLAAREVLDAHPDWNIKLYYNDYNEDNQNKAQAIYSMVKELNDKYALTHPGKLLIDGIGMQGHYNINTNPDNVKMSLEKFISLGVEVSVSELDIQAGSNAALTDQQAIAQGNLYAQLFKIYKAYAEHMGRVTFWGLNDATSWRASASPLLFDKNLQAKPAYYGVIDPDTFIARHPRESTKANQATAEFATPVVDGTMDAAWSQAAEIPVNRYQTAWQGATGTAKALWDDQNLYVLVQVSDAQLDKGSVNPWEQDSIEIFLDRNNAKTSFYQDDDGQYRMNFDNETSFNPPGIADGFESATRVSGTNYTVEAKIPLTSVTPANGTKLGFDVQINDAKDGARQSIAAWNDTSGTGYMDTSVFGELTLAKRVPPAAPTDFTLTSASSTSIEIDWDYASDAPATFNVFRATAAEGPFVKIAADLGDSAFTDTGLQPNTLYYYYVKVSDGMLESGPSRSVSDRTLLAPVPHLAATAQNHQAIRLNWDAVPSASYTVYRSATAGGHYEPIAKDLSASTYVDHGLNFSTTYYYRVVAVTPTHVSEPASAHATTAARPAGQGQNSTPNPPGESKVEKGSDGAVKLQPPVKTEAGRSKAEVSGDSLKQALDQAAETPAGKKQVVIEVPVQAEAKSYEVALPTQILKSRENFVLAMKTETATVQIPSNVLSNVTDHAGKVSIRVGKASTDGLDTATRERIGNRPIIDLNLLADDQVMVWNNPSAPVTVAVPYAPTAEELKHPDHIVIWYIDGSGKATAVPNGRYDAATGTVVFQTTHFSTYAVAFVSRSFSDLGTAPWAQEAVEAMAARDVIQGTAGNAFSPASAIKRADFAALLVRALDLKGNGNPSAMFVDVPSADSYYPELAVAKELGIAAGYGDNRFKPYGEISRQDMMALTARALAAAGKPVGAGGTLDAFADAASLSGYAKESAAALVKAGILNGKNGRLAPNDPLTRAEAAVILYRIWNLNHLR